MEYMESKMQDYIENGISEAERCYARIAELEEQNAVLAAQVEVLKGAINKCTVDGVALLRVSPELKQVVAATPQHHLCQVRADAVLQFAKQYKNKYEMVPATASPTVVEFANQYAADILAGKE